MRRAPLRGVRQRALPSGLPPGLLPGPRDAAHLRLACGRDGGFWCAPAPFSVLTGPPERLRAGRVFAVLYDSKFLFVIPLCAFAHKVVFFCTFLFRRVFLIILLLYAFIVSFFSFSFTKACASLPEIQFKNGEVCAFLYFRDFFLVIP